MSDEEYEYEEEEDEGGYEYQEEEDEGAYAYREEANGAAEDVSGSAGLSAGSGPSSEVPMEPGLLRTASGAMGLQRQVSYQVVDQRQIMRERQMLVAELAEWGISDSEAVQLLEMNNWQRVLSMDGLDKIRADLEATPPASELDQSRCAVCGEPFAGDVEGKGEGATSFSLPCNHKYCTECWSSYLMHAVTSQGRNILHLSCMAFKCPQVVPADVFLRFCDDKERAIYEGHMVSAFVDKNPAYTWCPRAGCSKIVKYTKKRDRDVQCLCGQFFCFVCKEYAHTPVTCEKFKQWLDKAVDDGETDKYLKAHTKSCPKCAAPIEIHVCTDKCKQPCELNGRPALGGCNHFTCSCRYEFCWLCMRDWKTHGSATGGYYKCNIYVAGEDADVKDLAKSERERLRQAEEMRRYDFYFQRYTQHKQGVNAIPALEKECQENISKLLQGINCYRLERQMDLLPSQYMDFLLEAVDLVFRCRRVLMMTYVFAFYLPPKSNMMNLLQSQQGMMEDMTNHVHELLGNLCADQVVQDLAEGKDDIVYDWKLKQDMTTYVNALTKFLKDIKAQITEWEDSGAINASAAEVEADVIPTTVGWQCPACTFVNTHASHQTRCEQCDTPRPV